MRCYKFNDAPYYSGCEMHCVEFCCLLFNLLTRFNSGGEPNIILLMAECLTMKSLRLVSCFVVIAYFVVYMFLTAFGRYEDNLTTLSKIYHDCLCISDLELWQPKYVLFTRYNGRIYANTLGLIYSPLIFLDQKCWHKDKEFNLD